MAVTQLKQTPVRPRIALTLGDPAGIGPELIAKLISKPENLQKADIFVLADRSELDDAIADAGGVEVAISKVAGPNGVQILDDKSARAEPWTRSVVSKEGGQRCLYQLQRGLDLAQAGKIDGIVFGPLNKTSLKMAGLKEEDELRWFAKQLKYTKKTSEINIAGPLWTGRVTSHIGLEKVAGMITKESTLEAIELLNRLRWESGIERPRLGVCALNPHNGENGNFGRQEIDAIAPAVEAARSMGIDVEGPFPCDTIFLKRSQYDGIVTMYHDQGQIALKLLSFSGGVTVQGGLPVIISTPAHGTAFEIAGKNMADLESTQRAFDVAVTMALRRELNKGALAENSYEAVLEKIGPKVAAAGVPVASCC